MKNICLFVYFFTFKGLIQAQKSGCDTTNNLLITKFSNILKYENDSFCLCIKLLNEPRDSVTVGLTFQNMYNSSVYIADKLYCSESGKNCSINSIVRNEPNEHHYSDIFTLYKSHEIFEWTKKFNKESIDEIDFTLEFTFNINKLLENYSAIRDSNDNVIKIRGLEKEFVHCGLESISILSFKIHKKNKKVFLCHTKVN